jgi:hypothetical protein
MVIYALTWKAFIIVGEMINLRHPRAPEVSYFSAFPQQACEPTPIVAIKD